MIHGLASSVKYTRPRFAIAHHAGDLQVQTLLREWAYAYRYPSSQHRADELQPWMHHYNFHRPHSAVSHRPPAFRLGFEVTAYVYVR